jgi:prefoldin subunit 5
MNNNDIINNNNNHINDFDFDINNNYDDANDINISNRKNINKKYHRKKKEINTLKEQIGRVKDQINNLMINSNNPDFSISSNFLTNPPKTTNNTESNINPKVNNNNNNNIKSKAKTYALKSINDNNNDMLNKKIEELKNSLNKERNKNENLEKEILSLNQYIEGMKSELAKQQQQTKNTEPIVINNIFSPNFFIKIFYNINPKVFSSSELKKYYKIYNTQNINTIFEIFGKTCECLKRQIYESHFEIDTVNTDIDDNCINSRNVAVDSSYRLVNERILKLKKLEFDFINLSEFVKNYLVSQEILIKIIFTTDNNVIQFEPIERLFKLFEDCLNFKIDEMNDNIIFHRKLLIKMLKNQKNCLGLSLESMAQQQ